MTDRNNFFCISGGSNLNAGSRDGSTTEPGTSADYTYASGNYVQSTGVFTVATGDPASDGVAVGDYASIYADGSTQTGFIARVTARDATTITVDIATKYHGTNPTDGTGNRTLKIGGAWAGPSGAVTFPFGSSLRYAFTDASGNWPRVNIKSDVAPTNLSARLDGELRITYQGYQTTPEDNAARPVFTWSSASDGFYLNSESWFINLHAKTTDTGTGNDGFTNSTLNGGHIVDCVAQDWKGSGFYGSVNGNPWTLTRCVADGCGTGFYAVGVQEVFAMCRATNCTTGFRGNQFSYCIADGCTTGYTRTGNTGAICSHCDAYDCTTGFSLGQCYYINCNAVKCSSYGFNPLMNNYGSVLYGVGYGGGADANGTNYNSARWSTASSLEIRGEKTYQTNPWTDPANGDFTIDSTKTLNDGTTSVISQGYSSVGTNETTNTGSPTIGACPPAIAGGGGLMRLGMGGGFNG